MSACAASRKAIMTEKQSPFLSPYSATRKGSLLLIENEFVRWAHDLDKGGELAEATVKNGSGKNLLAAPQSSALCTWVRGGWRTYRHYETSNCKASSFECKTLPEGDVRLFFSSPLADADGAVLEGALARHEVLYKTNGAAHHSVAFSLDRDMDLGHIRIGTLSLANDFNRLAVRPCSMASWAPEMQNPCQWIELKHSMSRTDLPAYRSRFLPLSMLFLKTGVEAIEISISDDLSKWDNVATSAAGLAQGSVCELRDPWRYEAVLAPLDSPRPGNILCKGEHSFGYRVSLPFVRERIIPLKLAGSFLKIDEPFERRWPDRDEIQRQTGAGVEIQRIHNDGDYCGNGIFWRDGAYPPYPAGEMEKMDRAVRDCLDSGAKIVPYFSCKEWHPEALDFASFGEKAEKCARQAVEGEKMMETFYGTSLFGMVMCLESEWYSIRLESIKKTLEEHPFSGVYFDWCMGLECINAGHGPKRHWDNDRLLALVEESRRLAGDGGAIYLHMTNVPSLAAENLGDMILVEESEYFEIFPEMFTPQVHFLNVAPHSVCIMLPPKESTGGKLRALAIAALLHHATLCLGYDKTSASILPFYREKEDTLKRLSRYRRHAAPGEGVTSTSAPRETGVSIYWTDDEALAIVANLSDCERTVEWTADLGGGRRYSGKTTVGAVDFIAVELHAKEAAPCASE